MDDNEVVNLPRFNLSTWKSALSIPAPLVFGVSGTFLSVGLVPKFKSRWDRVLLKKFTAGWKRSKHQPVKQKVFGVFWCPLAREPSAMEGDIARNGDTSDTGQVGDRGLCSTWRGKEWQSRKETSLQKSQQIPVAKTLWFHYSCVCCIQFSSWSHRSGNLNSWHKSGKAVNRRVSVREHFLKWKNQSGGWEGWRFPNRASEAVPHHSTVYFMCNKATISSAAPQQANSALAGHC